LVVVAVLMVVVAVLMVEAVESVEAQLVWVQSRLKQNKKQKKKFN
jgi:hypothetical protein